MLAATQNQSSDTRPQHAVAILAIVLVSYFVILLDNSVIFTGIPKRSAAAEWIWLDQVSDADRRRTLRP
jgi:hypothetical protein